MDAAGRGGDIRLTRWPCRSTARPARVQAVPALAKGHSTVFTGVSCLPWGTCVATGETGKANAAIADVMTGVWKAARAGSGRQPGFVTRDPAAMTLRGASAQNRISGLVALAAVLGGVAVPAVAMAQPTAGSRPGRGAGVRADDPRCGVGRDAAASRRGPTGADRRQRRAAGHLVRAGDGLPRRPRAVRASPAAGRAIPARVERWNGSSWKRLGVTMPAGTMSST